MKYFLIGFVLWFAIAWLPQFAKTWVTEWKIKRAKKRADSDDAWIYKI